MLRLASKRRDLLRQRGLSFERFGEPLLERGDPLSLDLGELVGRRRFESGDLGTSIRRLLQRCEPAVLCRLVSVVGFGDSLRE